MFRKEKGGENVWRGGGGRCIMGNKEVREEFRIGKRLKINGEGRGICEELVG
jgi:hypothetical protein